MPVEEILGLPAHPLLVHAAVVLVPLLIVVGIGYGVIPPLRRKLDLALVVLALVAPGAVYLARESGKAFERRLATLDQLPPELATKVAAHSALSETLWWLVLALGGVSLLLVAADRLLGRRTSEDDDGAPRGGALRLVVILLLTLALLGVAGAAGWYVYRTGHTGSQMVWEGS